MYTSVDMLQCRGRAALRVKAEKKGECYWAGGNPNDKCLNLCPVWKTKTLSTCALASLHTYPRILPFGTTVSLFHVVTLW